MADTTTDDMDSGQIMRRAYERGEKAETYDPARLVNEVTDLLAQRGLHPDSTDRMGMAHAGAGMLLRALSIVPAGGYYDIDRPNAPDADTR